VLEVFRLTFIGIVNIFYNLGLNVWEAYNFGRFGWWWQLRLRFFLNYLPESPYAIIKREGRRAPVPVENLIYGETPCSTIKEILQQLEITSQDHFFDLGCGRGLNVFFVNRYFQIPATGIDVIPTFIKQAKALANSLKLTEVKFERENLAWLTMDQIGHGTIFFMAGTAFDDALLAKITLRLELLPKGVRLITLSDALSSELFHVTAVKRYHFSWGKTDVYFHEKIA
jgi:SAM-dependent methyltransferase